MVLIIAIAVLGMLGASKLIANNQVLSSRLDDTRNVHSRLASYIDGFHIFESAPVTGVGVNQFTPTALKRPSVVVAEVGSTPYAHNSYLAVLAEQGLWGFVPFLFVTLGVWRVIRAFRLKARSKSDVWLYACAVGAMLAALSFFMTLSMLFYGYSTAFVLVLVGMAVSRLNSTSADGDGPRSRGAGKGVPRLGSGVG
jgi:O-antigen ligase